MSAMDEREFLAERFEENRSHLRAVAYRMLGSLSEAEDAVQETWLRLSRTDTSVVENLGGWLRTVIARVCLDMLRSRMARREESMDEHAPEPAANPTTPSNPEQEALLADSVGLAVLVVLDRLSPAERLAFVLHDMFGASFDEIGAIIGRTPTNARQLASRARRRVQGAPAAVESGRQEQREIVNAFVAALRSGDFEGLLKVLDPDIVVHIDKAAARPGAPREIRGATNWARGAMAFTHALQFTVPALVDGTVGLVWAPQGRLFRALRLRFEDGKIVEVDIVADPARLRDLEIAILN